MVKRFLAFLAVLFTVVGVSCLTTLPAAASSRTTLTTANCSYTEVQEQDVRNNQQDNSGSVVGHVHLYYSYDCHTAYAGADFAGQGSNFYYMVVTLNRQYDDNGGPVSLQSFDRAKATPLGAPVTETVSAEVQVTLHNGMPYDIGTNTYNPGEQPFSQPPSDCLFLC